MTADPSTQAAEPPEHASPQDSHPASGRSGSRPHGAARAGRTALALNVPLLLITALILAAVAPSAYFWHKWQVHRIASSLAVRSEALAQSGNWSAAAGYTSRYLQLRPADASARIRLAKQFDKSLPTGRTRGRAIDLYYQALAVAAEPGEKAALQLRLAELLLEERRYPQAREEALKFTSSDAQYPAARRVLAMSLFGQAQAGQQTAKPPGDLILGTVMADALRLNPRVAELAGAWAYVLREQPDWLSPSQRAEMPDEKDRQQRADATLDKLVAANDRDPLAFLARYRYRHKYQLPAAEQDLATALKLEPDRTEVLATAAAHFAEKAAAAKGRGESAALVKSNCDEAIQHYRRLIAKAGEAPAERAGDAAAPGAGADELPVDEVAAYVGIGDLYLLQGDPEKAIEVWLAGTQGAGKTNPQLNLRLVSYLLSAGRLTEAEAALLSLNEAIRATIGKYPQSTYQALNRRRDLLKARLLLAKGQASEALDVAAPLASNAQAASAERLEAWLILAECYAGQGNWDQAATAYQNAAAVAPAQNESSRQAAGRAWLRAGQPEQALRHFDWLHRLRQDGASGVELGRALLAQQLMQPASRRDWTKLDRLLQELAGEEAHRELSEPWRIELLQVDSGLSRVTSREALKQAVSEALTSLQKLEQQHGESAALWRELATRYAHLQKPQDADRALAECERLGDRSPERYLSAANVYVVRRDFERVSQVLQEGVANLPPEEVPALRIAVAGSLLAAGATESGRKELTVAYQADPGNIGIVEQLAELATDTKDPQEIRKWEDRLLELEGPRGTSWRYYRAVRLLAESAGQKGAALPELVSLQADLQKRRPAWPKTLILSGAINEINGNLPEAVQAYKSALNLGDRRSVVYERLVVLLYRLGRFTEADEYLGRLSQQIPASAGLSFLAISVAAELNDTDRAESLARQSIDARPEDPNAWVWYGQILQVNQHLDEAEQAFRKAIELAPEDVQTWSGLFQFQLRTDRPEQAKKTLQELIQRSKLTDPQRAFVLAQAQEMLGDAKQAEEAYRQAIALAPEDLKIQAQWATFLMRHDPQQAEDVLRKLIELAAAQKVKPVGDDACRMLAQVLAQRGTEADFDEAMRLLQQAGSDNVDTLLDKRLQAVLILQRPNPNLARAQQLLEDLVFNSASGVDADNERLAWVYLEQSKTLSGKARQAKIEAARRQYESLCLRPAPKPEHLVNYVTLLLNEKKWADAEPGIRHLEKLAPDAYGTITLRARYLAGTDRSAEILPLIDAFVARVEPQAADDARRAQLFGTMGGICSSCSLHPASESWYRRAYALDSKYYPRLAGALVEQAKVSQAVELCLEQAKNASSADPAAVLANVLVVSQASEADMQRAEPALMKALADFPGEAHLVSAVANVRAVQQRNEEAIQLYQQALRLIPNDLLVMNNLATLLAESPGEAAEALRYIDQAIQASGPRPALLDTKGMILIQLGRTPEAIDLLRRATEMPNADARYHFHLAVALAKSGDNQAARKSLDIALENDLKKLILVGTDLRYLEELEKTMNRRN